jgi:hypothetical protein
MNLCIDHVETKEDVVSLVAIRIEERMRQGDGIVQKSWLREEEIMAILHEVEQEIKSQ